MVPGDAAAGSLPRCSRAFPVQPSPRQASWGHHHSRGCGGDRHRVGAPCAPRARRHGRRCRGNGFPSESALTDLCASRPFTPAGLLAAAAPAGCLPRSRQVGAAWGSQDTFPGRGSPSRVPVSSRLARAPLAAPPPHAPHMGTSAPLSLGVCPRLSVSVHLWLWLPQCGLYCIASRVLFIRGDRFAGVLAYKGRRAKSRRAPDLPQTVVCLVPSTRLPDLGSGVPQRATVLCL